MQQAMQHGGRWGRELSSEFTKQDTKPMTELVHELITNTATRVPAREALRYQGASLSYGEFAHAVESFASSVMHLGLERGARVAVYAEKRFETVNFGKDQPPLGIQGLSFIVIFFGRLRDQRVEAHEFCILFFQLR